MKKSFYPYLIVDKLRKLQSTPVRFTFAVMQPQEKPGSMQLEFRGDGGVGEAGPSLGIARDGKVTAGKEIARLVPGEWTHFTIRFGLGNELTGTWDLTVKDRNGTSKHTLPFKHGNCNDISWIGLMADSNEESVFYLDDLSFQFGEDAR